MVICVGREARARVDPDVEGRRAGLLRLRLLAWTVRPWMRDLDRENDGDAERDGDGGERAAEWARAHGAHRQQPDLAHRSSLASLATRTPGSGIASGTWPSWVSATSSTTAPSRMIRTRSA